MTNKIDEALEAALRRFNEGFREAFDLRKGPVCKASLAHDAGRVTAPPLVPAREAARLMGLAPKTLENWRTKGQGPNFIKIGTRVAYRPTEIEAWLKANETQHAARDRRRA